MIGVFKLQNDNNRSSVCSVICNSWIKCCCISESSKLEEVGEKPTHIISIINDLSDRWHTFYLRGGLGVLDSDLISDKLFVLPAHGVVYMAGSARLIPVCLQQLRTADVFIFFSDFRDGYDLQWFASLTSPYSRCCAQLMPHSLTFNGCVHSSQQLPQVEQKGCVNLSYLSLPCLSEFFLIQK